MSSTPPSPICTAVQFVYESLVQNLDKYFPDLRSPQSVLPVLLDPRFKDCAFLELEEKKAALEHLKKSYEERLTTMTSTTTTTTTTTTGLTTTVSTARTWSSTKQKATLTERVFGTPTNSSNELEDYLQEPKLPPTTDVLQYWEDARSHRPVLAAFAMQVFVALTTSVECESIWSNAGYITSEKRRSLDPDSVSMLVFLHRNIQTLEKLGVKIYSNN